MTTLPVHHLTDDELDERIREEVEPLLDSVEALGPEGVVVSLSYRLDVAEAAYRRRDDEVTQLRVALADAEARVQILIDGS